MDQLIGIKIQDWFKLLRDNRFAVAPRYLSRASFVTMLSLFNSRGAKREKRLYGDKFAKTEVSEPIFVLGHWRHGTTLLHYLLAQDEQFTYPTVYQTSNPHTFLVREDHFYETFQKQRAVKRPMDNIQFLPTDPGEDEFALSSASQLSPLIGWSFTRRILHYDRFMTLKEVTPAELARWEDALMTFLKKVAWKYQKPLLIKSPTHTARIRVLLKMFPNARFIHIKRHPFDVFRSTERLYETAVNRSHLQNPPKNGEGQRGGILRRYREMYKAFFEDLPLIPDGRYYELAFEDLEQDKLGEVAKIYEALDLPGFAAAQPAIQAYVDEQRDYKKNQHEPLPEPLRRQVAEAWQQTIDAWGYSV